MTEIRSTTLPEAGTLTERALTQATPKPRRALRPYVYGSLALAATLPLALLLLPKPKQEQKQETEPVRQLTTALAFQKQAPITLNTAPTQEKSMPTQEKSMTTQEKSMTTQEKFLEEQFGLGTEQEQYLRLVTEEKEPAATVALSGLSPLSESLNRQGERGGTLALSRGLSVRLAKRGETSLTPLPTAPVPLYPQLQITLTQQADGQVRGAFKITMDSRELGVIPKAWDIHLAIFDAQGALLSTAKTELPGLGGTADVALGLCPKARHYQLNLSPQPSPETEKGELLIVAGYQVVALGGKVPPPLTGTFGESTYNLVILGEPHFAQNNYYKDISARLSVSVASLSDAPGYTVHGALFGEKGMLLSTAQTPLKPLKLTVGTPLQAQHDQEISLSFGKRSQLANCYQLAVTAPPTIAPNSRLNETPDASFTVASVKPETDGSLVLLPPPCPHPMEEIFKNPKLRDYTQIKLAPSVVVALKAKGITAFVGKSLQARGKSESVLYLARPAFEVTTVTVEKFDDIQFVELPKGN
ncbi:hypothetical protein [Armatimonas sp.]|uniref:hypothetical protein n=1 Tax=Armatimonas sp. TaxID=1872638 RepID=UPI0037516584